MSVGVGIGGGSVGRPAPTQKFLRAARGGGSVGRPYPARVGIGLGRRVGSVDRMLICCIEQPSASQFTPQTTAGPGTSTGEGFCFMTKHRAAPGALLRAF
eukprot:2901392-Prymnesium_polylepis.1